MTEEAPPAADLQAWHILRPLLDLGGYLPWTSGAMRPAGLVIVCNEVVHGGCELIVECGSGASTVVLARLLRERGSGSLVAIEHDAGWAGRVADLLRREALGDIARVALAPLAGDPPWYAGTALEELPPAIDLLVVDGPPAYADGDERSRAPALPFFETRLASGATVILDDLQRPGEREVLAGWEAETRWRFEVREEAGVAVGERTAL